MEKNFFRKYIITGIIFLFIGASVLPNNAIAEEPEEEPFDFLLLEYFEPVDLFNDYQWLEYDFSYYRIETSEYFIPNSNPALEPMIIVFVNESLESEIRDDIYFYCAKLEYIGKDTVVEWVSGGTAEDIKARILYYWNNGYSVEGAVLVGAMPAAWFYHKCDFDKDKNGVANPDEFPCDLFLMDLDGKWNDTDSDGMYDFHEDGTSGDTAPEIYVGRIDASQIPGDEITTLEKYFQKVHNYWVGLITGNDVGLTYVDHDWRESTDHLYSISNAYPTYWWMNWTTGVERDDYLNMRINGYYEFIQLSCHSSSSKHYFHTGGTLSNDQVRAALPKALFYNLFCCSSLRYTSSNCLGYAYILNTDSPSLTVVGSAKSGSMYGFDGFYIPFGTGYSFGQSFQKWFYGRYPYEGEMGCATCGDCTTAGGGEISWFYGMTILGDPTLYEDPLPIDDVAPTTTISIGTPQYTDGMDDWITSETDITLKAEDNSGGVGVKEIHYSYNAGLDWTIVQGDTTTFNIPDECNHMILYFAKDDLGNKENMHTKWVKVDNTPPTTTANFGTPYYTDGIDEYITPWTPITLSAVDGGLCLCGLYDTWYKINSDAFGKYTGEFIIPDECSHDLFFYSEDNIGNTETLVTKTIIVDGTPPEITLIEDPIVLWPANHEYDTFELSDFVVSVIDNKFGDLFADTEITNVSSDEPENAQGDGDTYDDIVIVDAQTIQLRAERQGNGDGRVYTINFQVSDPLGNSADASFQIQVPHHKKSTAIDSGAGEGYTVYYP